MLPPKIRQALNRLIYRLPGKKYILFERYPPHSDNTDAVFERMLAQGWNKRYKLGRVLWGENDWDRINAKNVVDIHTRTRLQKIIKELITCRAAAIIDCNVSIEKMVPQTLHLFLCHGGPIKSVGSYYQCGATTDYVLSQSPYFVEIIAEEYKLRPEQMVVLGYPRNDALFSDRVDIKGIFGPDYDKFVVWYPTYRQHRNRSINTTSISIPVIHDVENAQKINAAAAKYGVLLLVKPHPAQDLEKIKKLQMSNVRFIDDNLFQENGVSSYEFLAKTDGLITDYSSVFYDYMLTDKPIGLTLEDYDEYAQNPGFSIDIKSLADAAEALDTPEDFETFFRHIALGEDVCRAGRERVKKLTNAYTDNHSTQRVVDFVEEKIGRGPFR